MSNGFHSSPSLRRFLAEAARYVLCWFPPSVALAREGGERAEESRREQNREREREEAEEGFLPRDSANLRGPCSLKGLRLLACVDEVPTAGELVPEPPNAKAAWDRTRDWRTHPRLDHVMWKVTGARSRAGPGSRGQGPASTGDSRHVRRLNIQAVGFQTLQPSISLGRLEFRVPRVGLRLVAAGGIEISVWRMP